MDTEGAQLARTQTFLQKKSPDIIGGFMNIADVKVIKVKNFRIVFK